MASPRRTIAVLVLLVVAAAPGLLRLELRTDGHALVPPNDPAVLFDREVREHFGLRDPLVVYLETTHPDGIYNPATLRRIADLSAALGELGEVGPEHVTSLATVTGDRVYPGTLRFRPLLDPLPRTPAQIDRLEADVRAIGILEGTLVAAGGQATAILAGVPPASDRAALYRRVAALAAAHAGDGDTLTVVGAPAAEALLGAHILADLARLVPLAMGVLTLILAFVSRRFWAVVLGLGEIGACLLWTFGLMGWLGVPVYLPAAVLPVILTALGLADEIHIFWCYQRLLARSSEERSSAPEAVRRTMAEMTRPVLLTSLTTSAGFLSFLASPIAPVRLFGLFAAAGILFCLLWSLTVIPAALALLPPASLRRPPSRASAVAARLPAFLSRRRGAVMAALGAVTVAAALGLPRLFVQDSWIDGFAPDDPFREATERVHRTLDGTHLLLAHLRFEVAEEELPVVRGRQSGPLLRPDLLAAVGRFEAHARDLPGVGGVLGTHGQLTAVAYLWLSRRTGARAIPRDPERVRLLLDRFDVARGKKRRREVIDDACERTVVTLFLKAANFRDTARLQAELRQYAAAHLEPLGGRLDFAGDVAVSQAMIPAVVRTQVGSLLLALLGALAVVAIFHRSLTAALLTVLPAAVAVLWIFGAMGWLGVPLGVATSMFCSITLGIAVDFAIHFLASHRRARQAGRPPVATALAEAAPAITADSLAIAGAFAVLLASQVPANARLGGLVAAALVSAWVLSLAGLGALLSPAPGALGRPPEGAPRDLAPGRRET